MRASLPALTLLFLLGSNPGSALGQSHAWLALRPGVSLGSGASAGLDVEAWLNEHLSALVAARGVDSGLECLGGGPGFIGPCAADGIMMGGGLRLYTPPAKWRPFAEALAGVHRYRNGSYFGLVGGGVGLLRQFGPRVTLETSYGRYRIGADQLEGLNYTRIGSATRVVGSFRVSLGLWLT